VLKTVSEFKKYVKTEYQNWTRPMVVMTPEEREALRDLFKAVLSESDSGTSSLNESHSDVMFMLMLIHLKADLDKLDAHARKNRNLRR